MFYSFNTNNFEYDECSAKGACSIPPSISALQAVLMIILRQTSFYIAQLKKLEVLNVTEYEDVLIRTIANTMSTTDYKDEQLLKLVSNSYYSLLKIKKKYIDVCQAKELKCVNLKSVLSLSPDMNLSQIITLGEKSLLKQFNKQYPEIKNYSDLLEHLIKSAGANVARLINTGFRPEKEIVSVVEALSFLNKKRVTLEDFKTQINTVANADREILNLLYNFEVKEFGPIIESEVSHSTRQAKAILVSGSDLADLKNVLESVKDTEIDVYTHGDLIIAHAYEQFTQYKNLQGHFGTCNENCILDFATFPGAILLTRFSNINTEYLYRGRLFTTSDLAPQGVVQIKNNDYTDLIKSALSAKGFAKGQTRNPEIVGYNPETLREHLDYVKQKALSGEISHIVILGLLEGLPQYREYFEKLVQKLPENVFVLSFSYNFDRNNILTYNLGNSRTLIYNVLYNLFDDLRIDKSKISVFLGKCDDISISNIINMVENQIGNIFLLSCSPNLISPAAQKFIKENYNIREVKAPEDDIKYLLN